MAGIGGLATQVIAQLEGGEVSAVWDRLDARLQAAAPAKSLHRWVSGLDEWIGSPRRFEGASQCSSDPNTVQLIIEGPEGRLSATVRVGDDGRIVGLDLAPLVIDGIRNIVIGCPGGQWNEEKQRVEGEPRELGEF